MPESCTLPTSGGTSGSDCLLPGIFKATCVPFIFFIQKRQLTTPSNPSERSRQTLFIDQVILVPIFSTLVFPFEGSLGHFPKSLPDRPEKRKNPTSFRRRGGRRPPPPGAFPRMAVPSIPVLIRLQPPLGPCGKLSGKSSPFRFFSFLL